MLPHQGQMKFHPVIQTMSTGRPQAGEAIPEYAAAHAPEVRYDAARGYEAVEQDGGVRIQDEVEDELDYDDDDDDDDDDDEDQDDDILEDDLDWTIGSNAN